MTMTLVINGDAQAVSSGARIRVAPESVVQIEIAGAIVDPARLERTVVDGDDLQLVAPDGQVVVLADFVATEDSGAAGGLADAGAAVVVETDLEALLSPAAGLIIPADEGEEGGSSQAYSQATIGDVLQFGSGGSGASSSPAWAARSARAGTIPPTAATPASTS